MRTAWAAFKISTWTAKSKITISVNLHGPGKARFPFQAEPQLPGHLFHGDHVRPLSYMEDFWRPFAVLGAGYGWRLIWLGSGSKFSEWLVQAGSTWKMWIQNFNAPVWWQKCDTHKHLFSKSPKTRGGIDLRYPILAQLLSIHSHKKCLCVCSWKDECTAHLAHISAPFGWIGFLKNAFGHALAWLPNRCHLAKANQNLNNGAQGHA